MVHVDLENPLFREALDTKGRHAKVSLSKKVER